MYNKHELVMIPSKNKAMFFFKKDENILCAWDQERIPSSPDWNVNQHLYILSDEEVKEGDWFLHVDSTLPPNKITKHMLQLIKDGVAILNIKKIIATTDKSLINIKRPLVVTRELPHIPDSFINIFIDEYNKQNIIKQVLVEYVKKYHCCACGHNQYDDQDCNICLSSKVTECTQLVVNTYNNIVVKPVKTNWNKEEVAKVIYDVLQATGVEIKAEMKFINSRSHIEFDGGDLEKWIEDNL